MSRFRIFPTLGFRGIAIGLLCAAVCLCFSLTDTVRSLENWSLDMCYMFREHRDGPTEIVIIAIDDESLDSFKEPLMFITPELAKVVEHVRKNGASAVGIDFLIDDSVHDIVYLRSQQDGDASLLGELRDDETLCPVVLPEFLVPGEGAYVQLPVRQWQPAGMRNGIDYLSQTLKIDPTNSVLMNETWTSMGFVNVSPDDDMAIRSQELRFLMPMSEQTHVEPSFAFAVYAAAHGLDEQCLKELSLPESDDDQLSLASIPVDHEGKMLINYRGPPGSIRQVSFKSVLEAASQEQSAEDWTNKIVLIGETYRSSPDRFATPFINPSLRPLLWFEDKPELMPGVEVHANVIATLGDRDFITTPRLLWTPLLLVVTGLALGYVFMRVNLEFGLLIAFLHHWLWKVVCVLAFVNFSWRVEMMPVLQLGVLVFAVVFALRWRWIRRMMGMVKSEAIARAFEADPSKLDLKGEDREMTILFTDIRNFTTYSESHSPREVVQLLNEYFAVVVPVIERHGGVVNTYIGDGIMVLFGAPREMSDHAACAIRASIEMIDMVHQKQELWEELDAPEFRIGVGIHSGHCVVGTVGSPRRLDYTAIGDTVNTAARIEAGNKELGTEILASQSSIAALPRDLVELRSQVGEARSLKVKGKKEALEVHEITVTTRSSRK